MGKRVSFELADIITQEYVRVTTHMEILPEDDQFDRKAIPQAVVHYKVSDDQEPCMQFDVTVFQHRITLEMDFNPWSSEYMKKVEFLGLLGISYRVY